MDFDNLSNRASALHIVPLTELDARNICAWRYDGEYAVYNIPGWETAVSQHWGITDEATRLREFYALRDEFDMLAGFFRLHEQKDSLFLSLGLAPQCCGIGLGKTAMALIIATAKQKAPGNRLELEVRAFNKRAITCYERCGFSAIDTYFKETPVGSDTFIRMVLET